MPTYDKRNDDHIHNGGSDVDIEVKLSAATAAAVYGVGNLAGWYRFAHTKEGSLKRMTDKKVRRNEVGKIIKISDAKDELVRTFTCYQSDDATLDLIEVLSKEEHVYRYALPTGDRHQVWGMRNARVTNDWEFPTKEGEDRVIQVEVTASGDRTTRSHERATVVLTDQVSWPAKLAEWKDA